jgi:hypothetical protein
VDALPSQANPTCPEKLGNITRFAIGRVAGGDFVDITDEAEWDTRIAAVDATKVVFTPLLAETTFPSSAIIESSKDDNTSPFGEGYKLGEGSVTVTSLAKNTEGAIKDTLKALECYSDLAIVIFDSAGSEAATGNTLIPISNFFVGTKTFGGISEVDSFPISFTMKGCWDGGLTINALTWDANAKLNA